MRVSGGRDSKAPHYSPVTIVEHEQPLSGMAHVHLPRCTLEGCNYRLELYIDPGRLPLQVPVPPGFPSAPWRLTTPSEAHLRGPGYTLSSIPWPGFSPVPPGQGLPLLPVVPCPCRPICAGNGSNKRIALLSAHRSRASPITGTRLQRRLLLQVGGLVQLTAGWRPAVSSLFNRPAGVWQRLQGHEIATLAGGKRLKIQLRRSQLRPHGMS